MAASIAAALFVLSCGAIAYTYALYPLCLIALRQRGALRKHRAAEQWRQRAGSQFPTVSVIVPFHNEERWVERKLDNLLSLDYPRDRLEIIAVSDGSGDRTNEALERYRDRVRLVVYHPRRGKPTAITLGVAQASGEILVFTDANVLLDPQAIQHFVARYRDPKVGGVSGNVSLQAHGESELLGEGIYMRYERWLYQAESEVGTMVGADGALCSIRKDLFSPLQSDTITDDFALALGVIAKCKRVVYEPAAIGIEFVVPDVRAEFRRKTRMIAGGYQALWRYRTLLNPFTHPCVSFQLLSHKVVRWLVPFFLVMAFGSCVAAVATHPLWLVVLMPQGLFYLFAIFGWALVRLRRWGPVYLPYYFCAVNVAAVVGLWRYLTGAQGIAWARATR